MIKVASSIPMNSQPVTNGFHPGPPPISGPPMLPMVYSNPAATAELPEVNEPEKSLHEGEAKLSINPFSPRVNCGDM